MDRYPEIFSLSRDYFAEALSLAMVAAHYKPLGTATQILDKNPKLDRNSARGDVPAHSVFVKL
jgi:hypothetical protein